MDVSSCSLCIFTVCIIKCFRTDDYEKEEKEEKNDEKEDSDKENRQYNSKTSDILKEKKRSLQESTRALNSL